MLASDLDTNLRDSVRRHFMAVCIEILHLAIVCPFVRDVKSRWNRAAVRILTAVFKQIAVQGFVKVVYGVIESKQNNLRRLHDRNTTCTSQFYRVAREQNRDGRVSRVDTLLNDQRNWYVIARWNRENLYSYFYNI